MAILTEEIYISIDIETDGPCPGINSMLSLGAAAFVDDESPISVFSANLLRLEGAVEDPDTVEWWRKHSDAYMLARKNVIHPAAAMLEFRGWIEKASDQHLRPVAVAYPAGFDFTWVYWYLYKFTGEKPLSFSCVDIKTLASRILGVPYSQVNKKLIVERWGPVDKHTHVALEDAIEQGKLFMRMMV